VTLSLADLTAVHAHRRGHFLLSSGLHSADYLQCALFLADPRRAERAGRLLADRLGEVVSAPPDLVVAPALGGLIIGHEVARALGLRFVFTERSDGVMQLRRGFAVPEHGRVVVVEDVVTTGASTREVISLLTAAGAAVAAVTSIVDRTGGDNPFGQVPFVPQLRVRFPAWPAASCPLCAQGQPFDRPGSRQRAAS
jgi:orotate phosphoribosyltransferase